MAMRVATHPLEAAHAVLPSVPWQRCPFHLQQNAGALTTRQEARKTVAAKLRAIFNAPDRTEADRLLKAAMDLWRKAHPKLSEWAETAIPESLTVFDFPPAHRHSACAPPMAWNGSTGSCADAPGWRASSPTRIPACALFFALLAELNEVWMTGKVYLNFNL